MRAIPAVPAAALLLGLALVTVDCEAKRIGSAGKSTSVAKHQDEEAKKRGVTFSPTFRSSLAGSAAGSVAGSAAARAMSAEDTPQPSEDWTAQKAAAAEQERLDKMTALERQAQIEEAARKTEEVLKAAEMRAKAEQEAKALAEQRRQEAAEARRRAAAERQAEIKRQAVEREKSCVIRPVMSDTQIAHCKWVWSYPPP